MDSEEPVIKIPATSVKVINDALDKGMVGRLKPEEHGPKQRRNPLGYDKSTRSFAMRKMPDNPSNQGH